MKSLTNVLLFLSVLSLSTLGCSKEKSSFDPLRGDGPFIPSPDDDNGMALSRSFDEQKRNLPGDCEFDTFFNKDHCEALPYPRMKDQIQALDRLVKTSDLIVRNQDQFFLEGKADEAKATGTWASRHLKAFQEQSAQIESSLKAQSVEIKQAEAQLSKKVSASRYCGFGKQKEIVCQAPQSKAGVEQIEQLMTEREKISAISEAAQSLQAIYEGMPNHHMDAYYLAVEQNRGSASAYASFAHYIGNATQLTWDENFKKLESKTGFLNLKTLTRDFEVYRWNLAELQERLAHLERLTDFFAARKEQLSGQMIANLKVSLNRQAGYDASRDLDYHPSHSGLFQVFLNLNGSESDWEQVLRTTLAKNDGRLSARAAKENAIRQKMIELKSFEALQPIPLYLVFSVDDLFLSRSFTQASAALVLVERYKTELEFQLAAPSRKLKLKGNERIEVSLQPFYQSQPHVLLLGMNEVLSIVAIDQWLDRLAE